MRAISAKRRISPPGGDSGSGTGVSSVGGDEGKAEALEEVDYKEMPVEEKVVCKKWGENKSFSHYGSPRNYSDHYGMFIIMGSRYMTIKLGGGGVSKGSIM